MRRCSLCEIDIEDVDEDVYEEQTTFKRPKGGKFPPSTLTRPNGLVVHGDCLRGNKPAATPEQVPGQETLF